MEKISSIIPTNNRIKKVDMEYSHPVRPGVSSFGRNVGTTSNEREQIRNHLAEQKAAEQRQNEVEADEVSISDKGKQISIGEPQAIGRPEVLVKTFSEEMGTEPNFFVDTMPKVTPAGSAGSASSARSLDKYA